MQISANAHASEHATDARNSAEKYVCEFMLRMMFLTVHNSGEWLKKLK